MKKALKLAILPVFALVFASLAQAQTGNLAGKVVGIDGKGVKDAMIKIERTDVKGSYKVKTKKKGQWIHAGLPLGTYDVSCEIDGKVVDTLRGVKVTMGQPQPITFDLAEVQRRNEEAQKAAAAGQTATQEQLKSMSASERKAYEEQLKKQQQQLSKNKELNDAFNTAMAAKQAKDWQTAIDNFTKAGEIDPEQDVIWAQLAESQSALAQGKTGDARKELYAAAVASYDKALTLKPDAAYHNNKGLAMIQSGDMDSGMAELEKAAELDPPNAGRYYFNLGAVMVNSGNTDGAVAAFTKATEVQPDYAPAYFQLGTAMVGKATYKDDGSVEPAPGTVEAFQKYMELEPTGQYAAQAQSMIASLTGSVETSFENPNKKKKKK